MNVTCYCITYKTRVTKVRKQAFVLAKTKVSAKAGLTSREHSPIIQAVDVLKEQTVPDNLCLPFVQSIEFIN